MTEAAFTVPVWYVVLGCIYAPYHLAMTLGAALGIDEVDQDARFWIGFSSTAIPAIVAWPFSVAFIICVRALVWYDKKHPPEVCKCGEDDG